MNKKSFDKFIVIVGIIFAVLMGLYILAPYL